MDRQDSYVMGVRVAVSINGLSLEERCYRAAADLHYVHTPQEVVGLGLFLELLRSGAVVVLPEAAWPLARQQLDPARVISRRFSRHRELSVRERSPPRGAETHSLSPLLSL